ncbi:MAG: hypothetical protein JWQ10_3815 [Herbaspirillum sp.]|nr:hypothetical protein [Herbaspirillum sp.]
MTIFGLTALPSMASPAINSINAITTNNTSIHSTQPIPTTFSSFSERRAYRPFPLQNTAAATLRYQRHDREPATGPQRSANRSRQRREISTYGKSDWGLVESEFPSETIREPIPHSALPETIVAPASTKLGTAHRAALLFARTYANVFDCTWAEAQKKLRQADQTVYHSWRHLKGLDEVAWPQAADDQPRSAYDLVHAANSFTAYLHMHPALDDATALGVARHYLTLPATTAMEDNILSDFYQGVLQRGLHWIDPVKVRANKLSAAQILQTVIRHRHPPIKTRAALTERLRNERDVIIDEAALIAFNAQSGPDIIAQDASMQIIRAHYASALIDEWQDAALGLSLLPSSPVAPAYAKFWYDGAVLQNARGKDLEQIVDALYSGAPYADEGTTTQQLIADAGRARHLPGQPDGPIDIARQQDMTIWMYGDTEKSPRYRQRASTVQIAGVWLTRKELRDIVEKTMHSLMLDTFYPAGTPLHAIATVLIRLGPLHGIAFDAFEDPATLMQAFNRLKQAWHMAPHSVIAPALCAAHYLAQTSDVLFLDKSASLTSARQINEQVLGAVMPALRKAGLDPDADFTQLLKLIDDQGSLRRPPPLAILSKSLGSDKLRIYLDIQARAQGRAHAPETISYSDTPDLNHQLHDYLEQRLLAQAPLPAYSEDFLATKILRREFSMTDADLQRITTITIPNPTGRATRLVSMTPLKKFLIRAKFSNPHMTFNGITIDARQKLEAEKKQAADGLFHHPIVLAKSKEIARLAAVPYTTADIDAIRHVLVKNIMAVQQTLSLDDLLNFFRPFTLSGSPMMTSIIDTLGSGDPRQILGLLPFVIPLYDIEEGIRLGDRERAIDGVIHFGEDAIFTALGVGAEKFMLRQLARDAEAMLLARSTMSPAERVGVDTLRTMAALIPEVSAERLTPRGGIVAEDTYHVHTREGAASARTIPKALEAAASIDSPPPPHMLFLDNERRSIPAAPTDYGFTETDFRGKPIFDAPPVFSNREAESYYRLNRGFSLPGGAIGIKPADLIKRDTVANVHAYWQSIANLPGIRTRSPAPADMIRTLFRSANHPLSASFEQFWIDAYERSETAATIINYAYSRSPYIAQCCDVKFGGQEALSKGDYIEFMSDDDLATAHYVTPTGSSVFQRQRMWIHESIHWLTKLKDPLPHEAHNNRGGAVYLTDRILSELGANPPLAPRTAYKLQTISKTAESARAARQGWQRALRKNHEWTIAENMHLDKILDADRTFPASMQVIGENIADRVTVRQGIGLGKYLKSLGRLGEGNTAHITSLLTDSFASAPQVHIRAFIQACVSRSKTFRMLAAAWHAQAKHAAPIEIGLRNLDAKILQHKSRSRSAHTIAQDRSSIWINDQALYYFSEYDIELLNRPRQYAGAMIDLFLTEMTPVMHALPLKNPFYERGLGVLLENKVLQEMGDNSQQRICAALAYDPNAYLRDQSTVTRAAASEDGYLEQVIKTRARSNSAP